MLSLTAIHRRNTHVELHKEHRPRHRYRYRRRKHHDGSYVPREFLHRERSVTGEKENMFQLICTTKTKMPIIKNV